MKNKIMYLIIGILIGAIIATSGFLIYTKNVSNNNQMPQSNQSGEMMTPPDMPNGDNGDQPPEKPDGDNGEQPPEKPDSDNNQKSQGTQNSDNS